MAKREHSQEIKKRFMAAVQHIVKANYPKLRESGIAESVGISKTNYHRLKSSENNYPTLDNCAELCKQYKISASWLLLGKGLRDDGIEKNKKPIDILKAAVAEIEIELKKKK